ncbi:MAG: type II toxin-antitoxin system mRNA interferase toxin, RelE/StbE family [Pseudomonadales bacterium]
MWEVYEHRKVTRILNRLPDEALQRYEKWKDIVRISGPEGLRLIRGFNDEALRGKWKGHRSSRLNIQYRVIYKIDRQNVLVMVEKVTPHDYRRN